MRVTIVVPTCDAGDMLLKSLEEVDAARDDIQLVIVDNGSTDTSVERAVERFPQAKVIRYEWNTGYAPACNRGAEHATAPFILFLNTDAFLSPDDLGVLLETAAADYEGAIWQPVNVAVDGTVDSAGDLFNHTGMFLHLTEIRDDELYAVFATKGAALLVRAEAFRELGGFHDEYFAYFEESDLCWRARMRGWEIRVVPRAKVAHVGGETTSRILSPDDVRYLAFRNRFRTILQNASAITLLRMVPLHLISCGAFVLLYLVTGRPSSAASVVKALWWAVGNSDVWREQRAKVQHSRRVPDGDVLRKDLRGRYAPSILLRHVRGHLFRWERARENIPK